MKRTKVVTKSTAKTKGFTLVELVAVIVILAVASLGITSFMSVGTQMYIDTAEREEIIAKSRFSVERLNRDLRYALPNSLRVAAYRPASDASVNSHCIEYFPIEWSTFYTSIATGINTSVSITGPDMISASNADGGYDVANASDHYVVVYPTNDSQVYVSQSVLQSGRGRIVDVQSVAPAGVNNLRTVTFDRPMTFDQESTVERFYIVSDPISYCLVWENGTYNLYRVSNYGILENQTANVNALLNANTNAKKVLMAQGLANDIRNIDTAALTSSATSAFDEAPFRIDNTNLQRNSIVHTFLKFQRNNEVVAFNNEIHLRNSP